MRATPNSQQTTMGFARVMFVIGLILGALIFWVGSHVF